MMIQDEAGNFLVTALTRNGLKDICDSTKQAEVKSQNYYVQAVEVKIFTEQDNKKNIRQRYLTIKDSL